MYSYFLLALSFVTCEAVFGQRISALKNSTLKEPTKSAKDLKSHVSKNLCKLFFIISNYIN